MTEAEQKAMKNPIKKTTSPPGPWDEVTPLAAKILLDLSPRTPLIVEDLADEFSVLPGEVRQEVTSLRSRKWPISGTGKSGWLLRFDLGSALHNRMRTFLDHQFSTIYP